MLKGRFGIILVVGTVSTFGTVLACLSFHVAVLTRAAQRTLGIPSESDVRPASQTEHTVEFEDSLTLPTEHL